MLKATSSVIQASQVTGTFTTVNVSGQLGVGDATAATGITTLNGILSSDTAAGSNLLVRKSVTAANGSSVSFAKSRGTAASPTAVANADSAGSCLFYAYGGTNYRTVGSIQSVVDAYTSDTNITSYMSFGINSGTTAAAEKMRLDSSGLGIGTTANASAILDAQSTTQGVRMPNMTTTQKNAIASPAAGLMVFDTTLAKLCVYSGAAWQTITSV
jgi:hypothetical protein